MHEVNRAVRRLAACGLALMMIVLESQRAGAQTITEFSLPFANSEPYTITAGPDGNLWFTEFATHRIGRITPQGNITEFPLLTGNGRWGITSGPDHNLWFTDFVGNQVESITPIGGVTAFPLVTADSKPTGITAGPDGNLWFTEFAKNQIGRITPTGVITEFSLPGAQSRKCTAIAAGPDGNLWFTESNGNQIGRLTPAGSLVEFTLPTPANGPQGITAAADGSLWFTEQTTHRIGRIAPNGAISEFPLPSAGGPLAITTGPDGNLWFTESSGHSIGRITPFSHQITEFSLPNTRGTPQSITAGPDGNLWYTDRAGNKVGRLTTPPTHDSVVRRLRPITVTIPHGFSLTRRLVAVIVRNADILPVPERPGHLIQLIASDGDCPLGTLSTPDFDPAAAGAQNMVMLAGGESKAAMVMVTLPSKAFKTFNERAPHRCTASFTATAGDPTAADPSPNNTATLVIDVIDQNDY
jgi:streptogramin lyase